MGPHLLWALWHWVLAPACSPSPASQGGRGQGRGWPSRGVAPWSPCPVPSHGSWLCSSQMSPSGGLPAQPVALPTHLPGRDLSCFLGCPSPFKYSFALARLLKRDLPGEGGHRGPSHDAVLARQLAAEWQGAWHGCPEHSCPAGPGASAVAALLAQRTALPLTPEGGVALGWLEPAQGYLSQGSALRGTWGETSSGWLSVQ